MKGYHPNGGGEYSKKDIEELISEDGLVLNQASISSVDITNRKFMTNKGVRLFGKIILNKGLEFALNIGEHKSYTSFLKEIGCRSNFGIYDLKSMKGKEIYVLYNISRAIYFCEDPLKD